jgi:hypothetical protein
MPPFRNRRIVAIAYPGAEERPKEGQEQSLFDERCLEILKIKSHQETAPPHDCLCPSFRLVVWIAAQPWFQSWQGSIVPAIDQPLGKRIATLISKKDKEELPDYLVKGQLAPVDE